MSSQDEQIRAMRWLYEDEKSYRKAAAKLKLEELKAHKEKAIIRQYRKRQRRIWLSRAEKITRSVAIGINSKISRKKLIVGAASMGVAGLVWAGVGIFNKQANDGPGILGSSTVMPDFRPVVPNEGSQDIVTTENNRQKITSFKDSTANTNLTVSQQKLPDDWKSDPEAIKKLEQFQSAEVLDTSKGKLYIKTNSTGQQWAALAYNDVLIFIQSNNQLKLEDWYGYISKLEFR